MTRRGFTLVEVMVSLALTALIASLAAAMSYAVFDRTVSTRSGREVWDLRWYGERGLHNAFLGLEVGTDSLASFHGWPDSVAFSSDMLSANGATELRRIRLTLVGKALLVTEEGHTPDTVMTSVGRVSLAYLLSLGERSEWLQGWHSPATAPFAIRLITTRPAGVSDTMLFRIGRRG
jgi:prepilin-type N-terminal cleavage/methylation domain-containing protein